MAKNPQKEVNLVFAVMLHGKTCFIKESVEIETKTRRKECKMVPEVPRGPKLRKRSAALNIPDDS